LDGEIALSQVGRQSAADEWTVPRGINMDKSLHDLLTVPLTEVGLPAPTTIIQMMLMRDG
jgi:hypothetical protein